VHAFFNSGRTHRKLRNTSQVTRRRWIIQLQLSPAHPDYGKVGFTELEHRVRERAYQLYEQRGHVHGYALEDWLEAKAQVLGVTKGDTYLENLSHGALNRAKQVERIQV